MGIGVENAVITEFDGLGVERRAVMKREALAELEGPLLPIRCHLPTRGQLRMRLAFLVQFYQCLDDVLQDGDTRDVRGGSRIKAIRLQKQTGGEAASLGRLRRRGANWREQRPQSRCSQADRGAPK